MRCLLSAYDGAPDELDAADAASRTRAAGAAAARRRRRAARRRRVARAEIARKQLATSKTPLPRSWW